MPEPHHPTSAAQRLDVERRLDVVERDARDHAKTLSVLTGEISRLQDWRTAENVASAREDERDKSRCRRLDEIEKSVEEVRTGARAGVKEIKGAAPRQHLRDRQAEPVG